MFYLFPLLQEYYNIFVKKQKASDVIGDSQLLYHFIESDMTTKASEDVGKIIIELHRKFTL